MSSLDLPRSQAAIAADSTNPRLTQVCSLRVEQVIYLGLAVLALLAHLWGLGDRALHHDETLHAAYSWYLFSGRGYMHDPLLHGPLLYNIGALAYWIFGDNDTTARLGAALAGSALTLTPYLIRRELGRLAALLAALYLLISPVFLYYGRFIRHDIYSLLCEMLVFAAIVRYTSTRRPLWLYTGAVAFALMYVNQETSYLFLLIMAVPLILTFLWRIYRPGVALLLGAGLLLIGLIFVLPGEAKVDGGHTAQRDPQTQAMLYTPGPIFGWYPLETEDNSYALRIRNRSDTDGGRGLIENLGRYLHDLWLFFGHPAVLSALAVSLGTLGVLGWLIWGRGAQSRWRAAHEGGEPLVAIYASLAQNRRWVVALAIFLAIYALFFSTYFTNLIGTISGTTGSLLYWLAQHNVERGGQPAHYYLIQLIIYEPLLLLWGGIGLIFLLIDYLRREVEAGAYWAIRLIAWWSLGAAFIYTWAGEKMPWLTTHIALPLVLLAAWALQRSLRGLRSGDELPPPTAVASFIAIFTLIVSLCFVLMTAIMSFIDQSLIPPWMVLLFLLLLLTLLTAGFALRWNLRWALALLAACIAVTGGLYTARSAFRLAYQNGDIPREMLVYTQTSPDVMRVVRKLEEASRRRGYGLSMPILYDNETVWSWYLRDFAQAERIGGDLSAPPAEEIMAVLLLDENMIQNPQNRQFLDGFVIQRYPLRWWFPEDQIYRLAPGWRDAPLESTSLLGQFLRTPLDRHIHVRIWNYLIFREPGYPLGSSDFYIAVRPELANQIGIGLGGSLNQK
ncbi:flippase activity-associated protein Agl23 [Candidatus Oscillochloris fontis]|uniref:flippase activity-associated protein Agl23 n=1 Tax=Candidatus Oscillochloris fontis TaxID=2496868 RepID=UPI00101DCBF6|nr:flippase activity-associated protein Agl23 [Candidatus Oscillochloris fontis]